MLNATLLKTNIINNLRNIFGANFNKPNDPKVEQTAQAIASAVVDHIKTATINVVVNLTPEQIATLISSAPGSPIVTVPPALTIEIRGIGTIT